MGVVSAVADGAVLGCEETTSWAGLLGVGALKVGSEKVWTIGGCVG